MKKNSKSKIVRILAIVSVSVIVIGVFVWRELNKSPNEYTYEEYNKMTLEERVKFQESFKSFEEFDEWVRENDK